MRAYLIFAFVCSLVNIVLLGVRFSFDEYPRTREIKRGEDEFSLILTLALLGWEAFLLWGR